MHVRCCGNGEPRAVGRGSAAAAGIGLLFAAAALAATSRGPRERFWSRMTRTGAALGTLALLADAPLRRTRIGSREALLGLGSAAALYGTFALGDRFARRLVPGGAREIEDVYALRTTMPAREIAVRLVAVIGPAEELFWRGLVQDALVARLGRVRGTAAGVAAYAGVHIPSGNFTLVGAAGVAGAFWGSLRAAGVPMGALVVSHAAWDVAIFLIRPTRARTTPCAPPEAPRRLP